MTGNDAILMLNAHLDYLGRIDDFLAGRIDDPKAATYQTCALGKWYYGVTETAITSHAEFGKLGETHKTFHEVTDEAIRLFRAGDQDGAQAKLSEAYTLYSRISTVLMEFDGVG